MSTIGALRRLVDCGGIVKGLHVYAAIVLPLACGGCDQQQMSRPAAEIRNTSTAGSPRPSGSQWHIQDPKINPLDGTKTQFLSVGSAEGNLEHHYISGLGDMAIYKSTAKIVLCFDNGKLCGPSSIGARIDVDGFVSTDGSSVRLKYDEGQPIRQHWSGSDDHNSLFPYGREKQFIADLLNHKKLYFEFSKYEEPPQVVIFEIEGLPDAMKDAGLKVPQEASHKRVQ